MCQQCEKSESVLTSVYIIGGVFLGIASVAFALTAVVQTAFGRDIWSGAQRSARFAGWIVSALAAQAQVGRTASGGQPPLIRKYYMLLKLFEVNPGAAQPAECAESASFPATAAMVISSAATLVFVILSIRCIAQPLVAGAEKVRLVAVKPVLAKIKCKKKEILNS